MSGTNGTSNGSSNGQNGSVPTSLDLTRRSDQAMLRRAISNGWGITPEKMAHYRAALDSALEKAIADGSVRNVNSIVKTFAELVRQGQVDDHAEAGLLQKKGGDAPNQITVVYVEQPRPHLNGTA